MIVNKSNHLVEARYKLDVSEQRLILYMASIIHNDDKDFKLYKIKTSDFKELFQIKHKGALEYFDKLTNRLMSKHLRIFSDKNSSLIKIGWISFCSYDQNEGVINIRFDPKLKEFLLGLKEFYTSYKIVNVIKLKSTYSIRMYELLKQYEKIKHRDFTLNELRDILQVNEKYKRWDNFKNKVLNVAQSELKKHTDISYEFMPLGSSKPIEKLRFYINSNENKYSSSKIELLSENQEKKSNNIICESLISLGITEKKALEIEKTEEMDFINWIIPKIESRKSAKFEKKEMIYDHEKYALTIMEAQKANFLAEREQTKLAEEEKKNRKVKNDKKQKEMIDIYLKNEYYRSISNYIFDKFLNLDSVEKNELEKRFISSLSDNFIDKRAKDKYKEEGIHSKSVKMRLIPFLKKTWENISEELHSFDQFKKLNGYMIKETKSGYFLYKNEKPVEIT